MNTTNKTAPSIYVGTYAKYNNGSIQGKWISLEEFSDKESFYDECKRLHKDESDPEFMFQDFEGFPKEFYGESGCDDKLWDWLELDEDDRELIRVYADVVGTEYADIEDARDNLAGRVSGHDGLVQWAEEFMEETGGLSEVPENLRYYFDFEKYARDLSMGGDVSETYDEKTGDTWIFWNR